MTAPPPPPWNEDKKEILRGMSLHASFSGDPEVWDQGYAIDAALAEIARLTAAVGEVKRLCELDPKWSPADAAANSRWAGQTELAYKIRTVLAERATGEGT